jgi:hypothetical protein
LLIYLGALICLLAVSIGIDAAKKGKLLKKLAKSNELGYKLEDAIKSNLKVIIQFLPIPNQPILLKVSMVKS